MLFTKEDSTYGEEEKEVEVVPEMLTWQSWVGWEFLTRYLERNQLVCYFSLLVHFVLDEQLVVL